MRNSNGRSEILPIVGVFDEGTEGKKEVYGNGWSSSLRKKNKCINKIKD